MARVRERFRCLSAAPAFVLLVASAAFGQAPTPPATVDDALHQMSDRAGVIFAGQVIAVRRQTDGGDASGSVEVEFHVDQAIRGCTAGTTYTLREWEGLWAGGAQRYSVGQRLLMFLHAPGASGLSSPVDGLDGAIPIHGGGSSVVAGGSSAQYPVADLRWIGATLLRPVVYRATSAHDDHRSGVSVPFIDPRPMVRAVAGGTESASVPGGPLSFKADDAPSTPAQQVPVQTVIGMLRSWSRSGQKADDAVR